jgi:hypothetical protein
LTASRTIEEVAALIWTGDFGAAGTLFAPALAMLPRCLALRKHLRGLPMLDALQAVVSAAAVDDLSPPAICRRRRWLTRVRASRNWYPPSPPARRGRGHQTSR